MALYAALSKGLHPIQLLTGRYICVYTVFAKVFRFLPDIRSGKQIFFTSPNKNLPDRMVGWLY